MNSIRDLITAAVLDPSVKGGLRWPQGKAFPGCRYNVLAVWHTIYETYKIPSMWLHVRHADWFDYTASTGEDTREVNLELEGIASEILVSVFFSFLYKKSLLCFFKQSKSLQCSPAVNHG